MREKFRYLNARASGHCVFETYEMQGFGSAGLNILGQYTRFAMNNVDERIALNLV